MLCTPADIYFVSRLSHDRQPKRHTQHRSIYIHTRTRIDLCWPEMVFSMLKSESDRRWLGSRRPIIVIGCFKRLIKLMFIDMFDVQADIRHMDLGLNDDDDDDTEMYVGHWRSLYCANKNVIQIKWAVAIKLEDTSDIVVI